MQNLDAPAEYDDIEGIIRPAQNPHLFGHDTICQFLHKMHRQNHLHHALLFEGAQGIGKATLAFHLAWALLADRLDAPFSHIDEDCPHWRQIVLGCHPGLLHISRPFDIKTAKFRNAITVDEMRKVNHFMHHAQADHGWRIVIIDPADDMNRNSANALLKILEEPPQKALFIVISHHKGRLLPTIRSRCQSVHFKPLAEDELSDALAMIAAPIGFGQDASTDDHILEKAQGSVRQGVLLLAYGGVEIAQALDDLLTMPNFHLDAAMKLASVLSSRDAQIQFDHFTDHLLHQLGERARHHALIGELAMAERLAHLWQSFSDEIAQALAYNLDKKHFVLVLLTKLHNSLYSEYSERM